MEWFELDVDFRVTHEYPLFSGFISIEFSDVTKRVIKLQIQSVRETFCSEIKTSNCMSFYFLIMHYQIQGKHQLKMKTNMPSFTEDKKQKLRDKTTK